MGVADHEEEPMITIIWIAMAVTVLGSIELLARAAASKRYSGGRRTEPPSEAPMTRAATT